MRLNDLEHLLSLPIGDYRNRYCGLGQSFIVCLFNLFLQVDTFLRDNLDWMGRASNWAKFTATASIGVVHRGHMKESMNLLQPYLPHGGVSALPYSEGGALYALGLIHSNKGSDGNAAVSYMSGLHSLACAAGCHRPVGHGRGLVVDARQHICSGRLSCLSLLLGPFMVAAGDRILAGSIAKCWDK